MSENLSLETSISLETLLLQPYPGQHGPVATDHRSLCTPLVQSTAFAQTAIGQTGVHAYSRVSNPTVDALESKLGQLENALPALCCSTGLAAETVLFFSVLRAGDHVVCGRAVYGGTVRLLEQLLAGLGVSHTFVDCTRVSEVAAAIRPETKLVFLETPANPTLALTDIAAISQIAHQTGALVAVDNTFLTPLGQSPLDLGADVSVYSTTKLIEGHSAALGGALVTRDSGLLDRCKFIRKSIGCIQTPFHAWLTLQGLKTLGLRLRAQFANAARIAEWLESRPEVAQVNYPGLQTFAQAELAREQHTLGDGNVVSFELAGGFAAAVDFVQSLSICRLAEHVGTVETLITHSASMTHADVPPKLRHAAGISDGLLRLSVGLENVDDVIRDLQQGLNHLTQPHQPPDQSSAVVDAASIHNSSLNRLPQTGQQTNLEEPRKESRCAVVVG